MMQNSQFMFKSISRANYFALSAKITSYQNLQNKNTHQPPNITVSREYSTVLAQPLHFTQSQNPFYAFSLVSGIKWLSREIFPARILATIFLLRLLTEPLLLINTQQTFLLRILNEPLLLKSILKTFPVENTHLTFLVKEYSPDSLLSRNIHLTSFVKKYSPDLSFQRILP